MPEKTIYDQAKILLTDLMHESKTENTPNPSRIVEIMTELCHIHILFTEEAAAAYNAYLQAELKRKRVSAETFPSDREKSKSVKEAETINFISNWDLYTKEKEAEAYYKKLVLFRDSISNGIEASRTCQSYFRKFENYPNT